AESISVAETADALKAFNAMRFNGDGVITADTADQDDAKLLIANVLDTVGGADDRSGRPGVHAYRFTDFFKALSGFMALFDRASSYAALLPLQDDTAAVRDALKAVGANIDDFFVRCQLAAFDRRAIAALYLEEKEYYAHTVKD